LALVYVHFSVLSLFSEAIGAISLRSKLTTLQKSREKVAEGFELGDLVRIRGNVTTYNGEREIKTTQIGKLPFSQSINQSKCIFV